MEAEAQSSNDTKTSDDEPLMVEKKTQTSNQVLEKHGESKEAEVEDVPGTDTSEDQPLMIDNQTQKSNQVPKK